ncbi:MAG: hypothetical protein U0R50_11780 [Gaiellales bacterium]
MRAFWNRPLGSKLILVLSIAFLLEAFAPWQRVCQITGSDTSPRVCGWVTAYNGFGYWAAAFAAALIVWELLPIVWERLSMRGWSTAVITAILATGLAVTTLVKMIEDNEFQTHWAWIGFAIALATMLTAVARVRFRWNTRHGSEAGTDVPEPPASSAR